ncbi:MAG: hypothetical protein L0Y72_16965 [Gemmataceae bacterium]|nr:hypothetical protein [Gemmataceae bacterium]MCI0740743.1 hypothetical protein [Gemmataceae bacterium]
MKRQKLPKGWTEKRIRQLLAHYENQSEEEQVAEHESAYSKRGQTMISVPTKLLPLIRKLLADKARV